MTVPSVFKGFSTIDAERTRSWSLTDVALVRRDLLNHFHTRVGERVMRPRWGCKIWDYLFDQYSPDVREDIIQDAVRIISEEPRVDLVNINVVDYEQGVRLEIALNFKPANIVETMFVDFERRDSALLGQENWRF